MKRFLPVAVIGLASVFGLQASASEEGSQRKPMTRVVIASGLSERGERIGKEVIGRLELLRAPLGSPYGNTWEHLAASYVARVVESDEYASRLGELLGDAFTEEEAEQLAKLVDDPLLRKWFEVVKKNGPKITRLDWAWEKHLMEVADATVRFR